MRRLLAIAVLLGAFGLAAPAAQAQGKPIVVGSWPAAVGPATVTLRAEIEPNGLATTYLFEYTTDAEFRLKGFIGATRIPQTQIAIGTGTVQQRLGGLQADTAYRFRVIATNNEGTEVGAVRTLRTDEVSPLFTLPDGRGWELVSPLEKNGGEIQGFGENRGGGVIQAAAQGGAVTYTSASSFATPQGSPGPGQYVSTRGETGWATENVTLPMLSGTYPEAPDSGVPYQLFSSDLGSALVSNGRRCRTSALTQCPVENPPLAGSGAPAGYRNYYLRGAPGSFRALLSGTDLSGLALDSSHFEVAFAGATPDLAHVVISTCAALIVPATEVPGTGGECDPTKQNLYEKTGSVLTLINSTPGAELAAQGRAISADGNRVYFTAEPTPGVVDLYLREGALVKQVDGVQGEGGPSRPRASTARLPSSPKAATSTATSPPAGPPPTSPRAAKSSASSAPPKRPATSTTAPRPDSSSTAAAPRPWSPRRSSPPAPRRAAATRASAPTAIACSSSPPPN